MILVLALFIQIVFGVTVSRPITAEGEARVTCRVPRDAENRLVRYGIEGVAASESSMEGAASPAVYERWVRRIPCGAGPAFCAVTLSTGKVRRAERSLTILGCGD